MTQMEHAKKGFITEEMKTVALKENRSAEYIAAGIADGTIVIPGNVNRHFSCVGIGKGLKTKVNANIGTSGESCSLEKEIKKLETAVRYGAHSIMDLSTGRNIAFTRKTIAGKCPVMLGTVPVYEVFAENLSSGKRLKDITADDFFSTLHMHAEDGADFVTVHCGITSRLLHAADPKFRTAGMVSRGGSLTAKWMAETGNENPYFEYFDRVLDIAHEYDITVSLGDGMRPGAIADAGDSLQLGELEILGSLVKRCRERNVQVIIEGPGHVPIDEIRYHVEMQKEICADAPFYVLGPLVCDIAPGYDHITGAIGGALAASYGADFLCYVTPAEHLCLPDEEDVKQGVIASVIAAHAGDVAKKVPGAEKLNREMSLCRKNLDWEGMFGFAIDPETARSRRASSESAEKDYCSMCGELCAMKESL